MKLFGTNRKSKHSASSKKRGDKSQFDQYISNSDTIDSDEFSTARLLGLSDAVNTADNVNRSENDAYEMEGASVENKAKSRRLNTLLRIVIIICTVFVAIAAGLLLAWSIFVKPPDVSTIKRPDSSSSQSASGKTDTSSQSSGQTNIDSFIPDDSQSTGENNAGNLSDDKNGDGRSDGKYTFLFLGTDAGSGNTDTIIVATFDTVQYKLDLVSIPRDTMVNVSWSVKKVNTLHSSCGSDGMIDKFADLLGYEVDFYALVNLKSFIKLVDAIGGIDYNVPVNMSYDDPAQDLHIHINKGQQHLSGADAMKVMRFRKGYADADIGRIGTQQDLIKTAAQQILANADEIPLSTLIDIFVNDVDTDLNTGNLMWFAKEFFKMDMENISFHILPGNYGDSVHQGSQYVSYVTIYPDEWVEMINEYLNPFVEPVKLEDLNILTRDPSTKKIYPTSGVYAGKASWGN